MSFKKHDNPGLEETDKIYTPASGKKKKDDDTDPMIELDLLSEMESSLSSIENKYPTLAEKSSLSETRTADLKAILDISQAINSSLVLDDILHKVLEHAVELLQAERGFLMLLDESGELQFKTLHNIARDGLMADDFKISNSIANKVAHTGVSIYTSDAQADEKYSKQKSIAELNLRSIMCVPLKIKEKIIGVVYLDNSTEAKVFLQSDLYLFELFAEQAAIAIENAKLYENLLALKRYNENIVNQTPVGIIVVNQNLDVTSLNEAAFEILTPPSKRTPSFHGEIIGARFFDLLSEDQTGYWKRNLDLTFESRNAFEDTRYYYRVNDDEKVLNVKITPLENEAENQESLIIVIEDITEKVILENYVMLSEKLVARGEMAASIGHELNNYLAIISNSAELMVRNIQSGKFDRLERNSNAILENISKIKRFTDGLMDFSKLEKEIVAYDIRKLVEDLLFSIKPQKKFKGIEFAVDISHDIPAVEMDVGQIQQVLLNIIYNASDAIDSVKDRKGAISIDASLKKGESEKVVLKISDNGPGIEPRVIEKIFEPGFTTKPDGHGLGLANCRRIIENHFGHIEIDSVPNENTTFKITIPVRQPK
ncbi:MAG: GAF domain-containing protein [candidate division Zixibacteria bacterium]|nr:GAF domain-containing protein [candidate division Zixibacteria bacterium]NIR63485.1 GAF domain-containing protein [candidate division Zixibacteria bacterium]NIS17728.1 GAF domain-containing protein [candidate division Zixibacteria bacterium]NIS45440.1 GAF domain-containing protein [candidate division Zixibacteria bacterium]NIT54044.1 GAF domain-containing protein [candidate division Zixibacteria bacterium]